MMDFHLIFQFVEGLCHGNQIMLPNEGKLILCAFFARSPDGSMVLFRYYLLGGNTAAPSGLYARLCHAFLVDCQLSTARFGILHQKWIVQCTFPYAPTEVNCYDTLPPAIPLSVNFNIGVPTPTIYTPRLFHCW